MDSYLRRSGAVLSLGLLYPFLFYHFEIGFNVFFFDGVALLILLRMRPDLAGEASFKLSAFGLLFSAVSVVIVNSWLSLFAHSVSFVLLVAFSQLRELRFFWFGLLMGLISFAPGPLRWWRFRRLERRAHRVLILLCVFRLAFLELLRLPQPESPGSV